MPIPPFKLPVPIFGPPATFTPPTSPLLRSRDPIRDPESQKPKATTIIVAAVIVGLLLLLVGVIFIRNIRSRHPNPKYIPTPTLKRFWTNWKVPAYRSQHSYEPTGLDDDFTRRNRMQQSNLGSPPVVGTQTRGNLTAGAAAGATATTDGVDRNTSVRSVMTLPVYRPRATENEQVLGREGERDGIDVVVEMPTAEDEEALRENEMAALYQIRVARRRQIEEREERRRLRREARENNNSVALQEIRERMRVQPGRNAEEIEALRNEHERIRETRQRAVSSVSYGDLGVVRADGTRLRANSTESERIGLLSDAASLGTLTGPDGGPLHRRGRSASSAISIDTATETIDSPNLGGSTFSLVTAGQGRSRANSAAETPRLSSTTTRAGSSPEIIDAEDADLGESNMPPPGYDDVSLDDLTVVRSENNQVASGRNSPYNEPPPNYPGPAQTRNARLSVHMDDLAVQAQTIDESPRRSSRGSANFPQLPSLRLSQLPQIVIEPSSARP
ncbi:hypothetical protein B0T17DRAFT_590480 [Bombardia bombarda]|uniref:Uncharacterized protein n=1 Tax=Bombardia bombarda TaxID=252184 RepID=A0AA40C4C9_9PEZI|nr:hypothetical protein B0T17DRAFT_590480 [Bombardia bombarda]